MNSAGQSLNNDLQEISDRNDSNILVTNDGNDKDHDHHRAAGYQVGYNLSLKEYTWLLYAGCFYDQLHE